MNIFYSWFALIALITSSTTSFAAHASENILSVPLRTIDGQSVQLKALPAKVFLIVNTASQCGYTPQYEGLEKLFEKYQSQGLSVLGFPSNDFGGQEPGTNAQIKFFCQGTYHVKFSLFEKNPVSGPKIQPLFASLLAQTPDHSPVEWNFEKFLVRKDGKLIARFRSQVTPEDPDFIKQVEAALREN
jgi:glutathione peroxidase